MTTPFSRMAEWLPMLTAAPCARTTRPCARIAPAPTCTSPSTTAERAISGWGSSTSSWLKLTRPHRPSGRPASSRSAPTLPAHCSDRRGCAGRICGSWSGWPVFRLSGHELAGGEARAGHRRYHRPGPGHSRAVPAGGRASGDHRPRSRPRRARVARTRPGSPVHPGRCRRPGRDRLVGERRGGPSGRPGCAGQQRRGRGGRAAHRDPARRL